MYAVVNSGSLNGICCHLTKVEVDMSTGLPSFDMVGKLSGEVKEAKERVSVALSNRGYKLPPARITVNISPAGINKSGTAYDLPIAIGLMAATGRIPIYNLENVMIIGELGLNGEVRRVSGVLPIVATAQKEGFKYCIVPKANALEASYIEGINILPVENFDEALEYMQNSDSMQSNIFPSYNHKHQPTTNTTGEDYSDIIGQDMCLRAATIAAAGFHHMLIMGPPGSGKTMIAKRLPSIMPPLSPEESMEVSSIYSVSGLLNDSKPFINSRQFLAPHHTITRPALSGGGIHTRPGYVSLAHKGILFLDEFPEFSRDCIEILREPLENKTIQVVRAGNSYEYPADFMLIAAANPCPCGYYPDRNKCNCSEASINRYRNKISGPIRDRIDLIVTSEKVDIASLISSDENRPIYEHSNITVENKTNTTQIGTYLNNTNYNEEVITQFAGIKNQSATAFALKHERPEYLINNSANNDNRSSKYLLSLVMDARKMQEHRFKDCNINYNSEISTKMINEFCTLGRQEKEYVSDIYETMNLTARSYHKLLRVARTIADLDHSEYIKIPHLAEAVCYRG